MGVKEFGPKADGANGRSSAVALGVTRRDKVPIKKKRIRTVGNNIRGEERGQRCVVALRNLDQFVDHLRRAGFSSELQVGEAILPASVGPISGFNAEGKYDVHKDQPKETAYRLGEWTWQEFRGRYETVERSKIVEIPYKRYPRTFVEPPSVELSLAQDGNGEKVLCSPTQDFIEANDSALVHIINLFLEHFGECEILKEDLAPVLPNKLIRLNWQVLPQGRMPWSHLQKKLRPIVGRQPEGKRAVIDKRHEAINVYEPDFVAVGQGGFDGYVVFGFPSKRLYILESTQINNATYVLDRDWEELSTMSKAELLNNDLHKERIIHRENWFAQVHRVLNS